MPIRDGGLKPLTKAVVEEQAYDSRGVYALYDAQSALIYYGRAMGARASIKSRLLDHVAGRDGPCTAEAAFFRQETAVDPVTRELELIEEFVRRHGRRPKCNLEAA